MAVRDGMAGRGDLGGPALPEPLLTAAEMREADARTIGAGTSGLALMERAGLAVAEAATRLVRKGGQVLVLCGPGHNGGDGFVAARLLAERGYGVAVGLHGGRDALRGDAASAASLWRGELRPVDGYRPAEFDLVIDALLGSGLRRDLEGGLRALVERLNGCGRPILAVDIPTGIDSDSGALRGAAVQATRTVTFAARKPGHLLQPGRAHCGEVEVAEIGIAPATIRAVAGQIFANGPALWRPEWPRLGPQAHKYRRGHTLILSGGATQTGAARLAARGALRVGSGLVTLASPEDALAVNAAHLTAIMLRACQSPADLEDLLADPRYTTVALGPALGLGAATRERVTVALESGRGVVLDADALTSFVGHAQALAEAGAASEVTPVVTPHEGEFGRLLGDHGDMLSASSKLERARRAAAFLGAVVVLKGPDTVIASPDGPAAINENGTPYLATAGSGDVLTGVIAGLIAQGMPAFEAACAGVWLHAEAGSAIGPGLIAEDLPERLPAVLRALEERPA